MDYHHTAHSCSACRTGWTVERTDYSVGRRIDHMGFVGRKTCCAMTGDEKQTSREDGKQVELNNGAQRWNEMTSDLAGWPGSFAACNSYCFARDCSDCMERQARYGKTEKCCLELRLPIVDIGLAVRLSLENLLIREQKMGNKRQAGLRYGTGPFGQRRNRKFSLGGPLGVIAPLT